MEMRVIVAQHMHRATAIVDELPEGMKRNAVNHCPPFSSPAYFSICEFVSSETSSPF